MSIVLIILSVITFIIGAFMFSPMSAMQEVSQFLLFVCSSIFLSSGFICIAISQLKKALQSVKQNKIKTYDDLINDLDIKSEADSTLQLFGKDAKEKFLQKKAKQFGIEYPNK